MLPIKRRKLGKSEMLSVRLDPYLKFAAQLAAVAQRQTVAGFVEWATRQAAQRIGVLQRPDGWVTALQVAEAVWSEDEVERFLNLAQRFPELLTYTEKLLWDAARRAGCTELEPLRERWDALNEQANARVARFGDS